MKAEWRRTTQWEVHPVNPFFYPVNPVRLFPGVIHAEGAIRYRVPLYPSA
jgi:hypothetical protein